MSRYFLRFEVTESKKDEWFQINTAYTLRNTFDDLNLFEALNIKEIVWLSVYNDIKVQIRY